MSINENQILIVFLIFFWSILLGTYFSKFIELLSSNLISTNLISLIEIMGIITMFFLFILVTSYIVSKMKDENEDIVIKLIAGLSILYIAGFILAIIPTNNLTMFEYYVIISSIISIILYLYLIREGYLFMNGNGLLENFVFWSIIWSIMLGWYFFTSIEFIAYALSIPIIVLIIFFILLASYFLSEIEDLDGEELKRLYVGITILYLIGDILAVQVGWLIFIWIVFILLLSVVFFEIILIIIMILLLIVLIMVAILNINILNILGAIMGVILNTNTLIGVLLMLTILVIQIIILLLTYNKYEEIRNEPPGF